MQIQVAANEERAYMGFAPTLTVVKHAYSEAVAEAWVMAQIENLNDFCGVQKKMEESQMEEVSRIILVDYSFLKVAELMLFFHRFKSGKYGEFYGVVDPQRLLSALNKFLNDRFLDIARFERTKANKERDETGVNRISYAEYLKMKAEKENDENKTELK